PCCGWPGNLRRLRRLVPRPSDHPLGIGRVCVAIFGVLGTTAMASCEPDPSLYTIAPRSTAMGPIVLFDKSFVEMLTVAEAALFDFLYLTNICPMFLTEVLADLEKETSEQRTREKIVADVARKTPSAHSYPNRP